MSLLTKTLNGAVFFTGFIPSFTRIGYRARRARWQPLAPDFAGHRWLVTGASTGLGREIALAAAAAGEDPEQALRGELLRLEGSLRAAESGAGQGESGAGEAESGAGQ